MKAIDTVDPGGHPVFFPPSRAPAPNMMLTHGSTADLLADQLSWQPVTTFDPLASSIQLGSNVSDVVTVAGSLQAHSVSGGAFSLRTDAWNRADLDGAAGVIISVNGNRKLQIGGSNTAVYSPMFSPYNSLHDFGRSSTPWRDGHFGRTVYASTFSFGSGNSDNAELIYEGLGLTIEGDQRVRFKTPAGSPVGYEFYQAGGIEKVLEVSSTTGKAVHRSTTSSGLEVLTSGTSSFGSNAALVVRTSPNNTMAYFYDGGSALTIKRELPYVEIGTGTHNSYYGLRLLSNADGVSNADGFVHDLNRWGVSNTTGKHTSWRNANTEIASLGTDGSFHVPKLRSEGTFAIESYEPTFAAWQTGYRQEPSPNGVMVGFGDSTALRPSVDPNTISASQLAQHLIDLGLFTSSV